MRTSERSEIKTRKPAKHCQFENVVFQCLGIDGDTHIQIRRKPSRKLSTSIFSALFRSLSLFDFYAWRIRLALFTIHARGHFTASIPFDILCCTYTHYICMRNVIFFLPIVATRSHHHTQSNRQEKKANGKGILQAQKSKLAIGTHPKRKM